MEFCIWDPLKEGEASFLFEWAGSFPCKVFGIISVQLLCCSRSLSCMARAVHLISACAVNLMRMCWIYGFVHICYRARAVGICSVSLTRGSPSRRMAEGVLLLPGMSCGCQVPPAGGVWSWAVAEANRSRALHVLWESHVGYPVLKEWGNDAASCFKCADQLDRCQGLVPWLTKPTVAALQSLPLLFAGSAGPCVVPARLHCRSVLAFSAWWMRSTAYLCFYI